MACLQAQRLATGFSSWSKELDPYQGARRYSRTGTFNLTAAFYHRKDRSDLRSRLVFLGNPSDSVRLIGTSFPWGAFPDESLDHHATGRMLKRGCGYSN
jgi:hypothetical protein